MVLTHIVVGMALAIPVVLFAPDLATVAAISGAIGGAIPDLDLLVGEHRRTLHFPVLCWPLACIACVIALVVRSPVTVAVAVAFIAAAVHATSDVFGAGNELQPWERTKSEAVFDHLRGQWLHAWYAVRYDGSPEDFTLTVIFATLIVGAFDGVPQMIAVVSVLVAIPYVIFRKRLPGYFEKIL